MLRDRWRVSKRVEEDWDSWQDPHRAMIPGAVRNLHPTSLHEIGCGAGANLRLLRAVFPDLRLSGSDVCLDAVEWMQWQLGCEGQVGALPEDVHAEVMLSCYTMAYLDHDSVVKQVSRFTGRALILLEPHGNGEYTTIIREDGSLMVPRCYHNYSRILTDLGWRCTQGAAIPPVDGLKVMLTFERV